MAAPTVLLILLVAQPCWGRVWAIPPAPPAAAAPWQPRNEVDMSKRENVGVATGYSTCGYLSGDANHPLTAPPRYDCRVDPVNSLWGVCDETIIDATFCGFYGACIDHDLCEYLTCGSAANPGQVITCGSDEWCSERILTYGPGQTYTAMTCGGHATTEYYHLSPTTTIPLPTSATARPSSTQKPGITPLLSPAQSSTQPSQSSTRTEPSAVTSTNSAAGSRSSNDNNKPDPASGNLVPILGSVLGGIALLCLSGLAAIFLLRRSRSNRSQSSSSPPALEQTDANDEASDTRSDTCSKHATGGWGPSELPDSQLKPRENQNAVELPS
ncbi:hypothetical protein E4U43_003509 [Claviceps pusilla]|uniref:Uncharacterized protein n=1 Tax=Claviceps pusilla TaxID=123648 RepID=A0A9P7NHX4_9HYPO|nr:hypothetical protein E4U43_003509 [Claviceps pusilla]